MMPSKQVVLESAAASPDAPVVSAHVRARGGPGPRRMPVFGDDVWDLRALRERRNLAPRMLLLDFRRFVDPARRLAAKEFLYARLHVRADHFRVLSVTSVGGEFLALALFFDYLDREWAGIPLAAVTQPVLDAFLAYVCSRGPETGLAAQSALNYIVIPIKIAAYADFLSGDRLLIRPWDGRRAGRVVGLTRADENTTPRIPEVVLNPLIRWALFYVEEASADILAACTELERLRGRERRTFLTRGRLQAWIDGRRASGRGVPAHDTTNFQGGVHRSSAALARVNLEVILLQVGCRSPFPQRRAGRALRAMLVDAVEELGLEPGGMDTPIVAQHPDCSGPWRGRFSPGSLLRERHMLLAACYIIVGYLSGMRDSEIVHLRRGCHVTESTADGLVTRHKLRGTAFKGHGRQGAPKTWVVIEPVVRAVAVLEQLSEDEFLFGPCYVHSATRARGLHTVHVRMPQRLDAFCAYLNATQSENGRPVIPDVDGERWHVVPKQLRRTLAWHIARQPFGVVAGKVQYGQVSVVTFEGYAGQSASGFRVEVEDERRLRQLDDVVAEFERWRSGGRSTAPGANRLNRLFADVERQLGEFPGERVSSPDRIRAMLQHVARTLYPGVLNDCFFDPTVALCLRGQSSDSPMLSRCVPGCCPNSRITPAHVPAWRRAIISAEELLAQRRLSVLQRRAITTSLEEMRRVIAPLEEEGGQHNVIAGPSAD